VIYPVKQNLDIVRSMIVDQVNTIYCTQVHLYERCTEVIESPNFAEVENTLFDAIAASVYRINKIELFYNSSALDYSFESCESMITQLEDLFGHVYTANNNLDQHHNVNNYLIYNHGNANAANSLIKILGTLK